MTKPLTAQEKADRLSLKLSRAPSSLVTADELEVLGLLRKGTAYKMAAAGKLVHYVVGNSGGGIRFRVDEVLAALRRPASHEVSNPGLADTNN
jgi:hypothetical protein